MHTVPRIIGRAILETISSPSSVGLAHSTISSMVRHSHSMPPMIPARQRCSFFTFRLIYPAPIPAMILVIRQGTEVMPSISIR
ncbi:hypothetical protein D3C75_1335780 [compost metagenome]